MAGEIGVALHSQVTATWPDTYLFLRYLLSALNLWGLLPTVR